MTSLLTWPDWHLGCTSAAGSHLIDALLVLGEELAEGASEADRSAQISPAFKTICEAGILKATVPEAHGGYGIDSLADTAALIATVARFDSSVALVAHMQLSRGLTAAFDERASSQLRAALLLDLMGRDGAIVAGATEDRPGSVTRATMSGDRWSLSGAKTRVTAASLASHILVSARVELDPGAGYVSALLRSDADGLDVSPGIGVAGLRGAMNGDLVLQECEIAYNDVVPISGTDPEARLLGQVVANAALLGLYLGIAEQVRGAAFDAVRTRTRASTSGERHAVGEIARLDYEMHILVSGTLKRIDAARDSASDERGGTLSMAILQAARLAVRRLSRELIELALVVVGAPAYVPGNVLERATRDAAGIVFMGPYGAGKSPSFLESTVCESLNVLNIDVSSAVIASPNRSELTSLS